MSQEPEDHVILYNTTYSSECHVRPFAFASFQVMVEGSVQPQVACAYVVPASLEDGWQGRESWEEGYR
jgi:hypothetical protein